jgi:N-ethylmaleimide reductase
MRVAGAKWVTIKPESTRAACSDLCQQRLDRRTIIRKSEAIFQPAEVVTLRLSNRIAMAPLTRNRAGAGLVPSEFAAKYYSQRATAGPIVTEATQSSAQAQGHSDTPGCYSSAQVAG